MRQLYERRGDPFFIDTLYRLDCIHGVEIQKIVMFKLYVLTDAYNSTQSSSNNQNANGGECSDPVKPDDFNVKQTKNLNYALLSKSCHDR